MGIVRSIACCLLIAGCVGETSRLPEGDLTSARSGRRLRARFLGVEDASAFIHFLDTKFDVACNFAQAEDGLYCLPVARSQLLYVDAACTRAALYALEPGLVTTHDHVYRVGEAAPSGPRYYDGAGGCSDVGQSEAPYRLVEEKLDFSEFVSGEELETDANVRLTRKGVVGDDDSWVPGGWFDRELEMKCSSNWSREAGPGRCGPTWGYQSRLYGAGCEQEAIASDEEPPPFLWHSEPPPESAECVGLAPQTLRRVEHEIPEGELSHVAGDGSCRPTTVYNARSAYLLSDPLDPEAVLEELDGATVGEGELQVLLRRTADGRFNPFSLVSNLKYAVIGQYLGDFVLAGGGPCEPVGVGSKILCLPIVGWSRPEYFADSRCTEPVATGGSGEGLILVVGQKAGALLGLRMAAELRVAGDQVPAESIHSVVDGACVSTREPFCTTYRRVGERADVSGYPELTVRTE
jgi:hypothetical protein